MASLGTMINKLSTLVGTHDLTDWESNFVRDIAYKTDDGCKTHMLSGDQVEKVQQIWSQHFRG